MEAFLKSNNVDEDIIEILKENDVDMEVLKTVTEQDLKDIGVNSFGKRRKLSILLATLNAPDSEGSAPSTLNTSTTSPTPPSAPTPDTPEQIAQVSKRLRLSPFCPLMFDLVGDMKRHVEGRTFLLNSIMEGGIPPTNKQRKVIVNVAVASLIEKRGLYPTAAEKTLLAKEIIRVFPSTKDTTPGMEGYEHFYQNGNGFIEYKFKNLRLACRPNKMRRKRSASSAQKIDTGSPVEATDLPNEVDDDIKEKVNLMMFSPVTTDNKQSHLQLFGDTFQYRRQLVAQGQTITRIFNEFPRFRDMPELINAEFEMLHLAESGNFIAKWSSQFADRVLIHGRRESRSIRDLIESYDHGDGDLCALLVVFKLLHSNATIRKGQQEAGQEKNREAHAMDFLIQHVPEGTDIEAFASDKGDTFTKPFILAVGPIICPVQYFLVIDSVAIEAGVTVVSAFDMAFKAHSIFNVRYPTWTQKFWQFIGLHVYGIPIPTTAIVRSLGSTINNTLCIPINCQNWRIKSEFS